MTTFCIIVHSSHMSPGMCAHLPRSGEKPVYPSTTRGCVIDDSPPCTIVAASAGDCTMSIDAETPMGMGYEGGIPSKKVGEEGDEIVSGKYAEHSDLMPVVVCHLMNSIITAACHDYSKDDYYITVH